MQNSGFSFHSVARAAACIAFATVTAGCGTTDKIGEWWKGGASEAPRLAPGAGEFVCDGSKVFQARLDAATRSAWVRFPDREFRLDAVPGADAGRYTNGRTTLNIKGEEAFLTEGTAVTYANCKRVASG